jgi:hypothetical protein
MKAAWPRYAKVILKALKGKKAAGVPAYELGMICLGYRQRISELRKLGHVIRCVDVKGRNVYRYIGKLPNNQLELPR